jgi:ribosome modulation factor
MSLIAPDDIRPKGRAMPHNAAYDEGYDAYWDGGQREENPYDPEKQPQEHAAWREGWEQAQQHDYDESEG